MMILLQKHPTPFNNNSNSNLKQYVAKTEERLSSSTIPKLSQLEDQGEELLPPAQLEWLRPFKYSDCVIHVVYKGNKYTFAVPISSFTTDGLNKYLVTQIFLLEKKRESCAEPIKAIRQIVA